MAGWTRFVIAHRKRVLLVWVLVVLAAFVAQRGLSGLLSDRFSLPGAESDQGFQVLKNHFREQGDGFTLVVVPRAGVTRAQAVRVSQRAADRGARVLGGSAGQAREIAPNLLIAEINSPLTYKQAKDATPKVRRAIGQIPGATRYLTGAPAINHDNDPLFAKDLQAGESVAIPVALLVLAFMLGTLGAIAIPLVFALATIVTTLGLVWIVANLMTMSPYVTNIVTLIGFAIAIDYSMLVVFRFREELHAGADVDDALATTMGTAGRATVFSGMTVALGLGLLAFMPLPFMQSMGIGGVLVPLVSIAACLTLLPALLAAMGQRVNRLRVVPRRVLEGRQHTDRGAWATLARSIMKRPVAFLVAGLAIMVALMLPALQLKLTGGDNRGVPKITEATRGLALLEKTLGPGSLSPNQIVVDTGVAGGAFRPAARVTQRKLEAALRADPEVDRQTILGPAGLSPQRARRGSLVDPSGRYWQVRGAGRSDTGTIAAQDLLHRIRDRYVPASGAPAARTWVTGGPAFGVDFIDVAYSAFPYLVAAVLVLTYLILLRAFRSLLLPLKAVLMNLVSVSATFGVLVLAFPHHWGSVFGWDSSPQIEAWIPIFLFAVLFGLSMDYEVFLLSRMREEWDRAGDNQYAVASGLQHTGRIITACAIIMIAAFSGFAASRFIAFQEFGLGLAAAVFFDATIVRMLLVPSVMRLLGDWNWWLPGRVARLVRARTGSA